MSPSFVAKNCLMFLTNPKHPTYGALCFNTCVFDDSAADVYAAECMHISLTIYSDVPIMVGRSAL